jgi:1,4-dihydroxy-2-naphthoate octaprenyltransferase
MAKNQSKSKTSAKKKSVDPRTATRATLGQWISAARLRTLSLAVAPVAFGTGVASVYQSVVWLNAALALAVALFLQIGVNYANDYSDGVRGTDNNRVGPFRLTASRLVNPKSVRNTAYVFFALAAVTGASLAVISNEVWLIGVGAVAIIAAWFYTGGKRPYGYSGLGEVVSFIFFGPVAVFGTAYVQVATMFDDMFTILQTAAGSIAIGGLAAAVLLVNNLRDIDTDAPVGKRTVSVRFGALTSKVIFSVLVAVSLGVLIGFFQLYPVTIFAFSAFFLLIPAVLIVWTYRQPRELVLALKLTSFGALAWGALVGWGLHTFLIG